MTNTDKRVGTLRMSTRIITLDLTVRTENTLHAWGVETIGQLVEKTENEFLQRKNCGRVTVRELQRLLQAHGLRLGMSERERWSAETDNVEQKWSARGLLSRVPLDKRGIVAQLLENQEQWLKSPERKPEDFTLLPVGVVTVIPVFPKIVV